MKRTVLVFVCAFVFVSFMEVRAQLSKAEKKEWKSKVKEFKKNPELLKNLMEERDNLRNKASQAEAKANSLQSGMDDKDSKVSELHDSGFVHCRKGRISLRAGLTLYFCR